jgi:hypothetical protein
MAIFSLRAGLPRVRPWGGCIRVCGCRSPAGRQVPPESRRDRGGPERVVRGEAAVVAVPVPSWWGTRSASLSRNSPGERSTTPCSPGAVALRFRPGPTHVPRLWRVETEDAAAEILPQLCLDVRWDGSLAEAASGEPALQVPDDEPMKRRLLGTTALVAICT